MSSARRQVGLAGAVLAFGAALAAVGGLVGAVWPWADALNHFAPVWLVLAWTGGLSARFLLAPGRVRGGATVAAALAVMVAGAPMAVEAYQAETEPAPGPAALTILSFNRWWDSPDGARQAAAIRASGADLVALQEADGFAAEAAAMKDLYPYQLFCGGRCDTAILSKRPFLATGREDHARWGPGGTDFLWARTTAADGRPVTLATAHLYWPIPPWLQRYQRARIAAQIAALPHDELVLTGDLNLTPWSFTLRGFDRTLAPLTRRTHGLLSFPATWPVPVLALDQAYAGPGWRTVDVRTLPRAGSDHYPLLVQLKR
ncbi:MAG TPA: endonuclease/exonuclease/phosphatase family protein [Caulobacteraceae bacterium]|nr:endonuclease/exonuclease/phosphatase family protein [Caulobacteraceae bacterium]